jgi:hypothetical protein
MNKFTTSTKVTLPSQIHGLADAAAQHRVRTGVYVLVGQILLITFIVSAFSAGPLLVVATLVAMAPAGVILTLWVASSDHAAPAQADAEAAPLKEEPPEPELEQDLQEEKSTQPSISDQIEAVADHVLNIVPTHDYWYFSSRAMTTKS